MVARSAVLVAASVLSLGACATARQPQPSARLVASHCGNLEGPEVAGVYAPGKVARVEPIYRQQFVVRAYQPRYVAGAELYVPAEPWMQQAYMERALSCHASAAATGHPNDPLHAPGVVDVDVDAVGPMMRISVLGADMAAGKAIYQRAVALQEDVAVEQLSAAPRLASPPAL